MPKPGRSDTSFESADGKSLVRGVWHMPGGKPWCCLQIAHGMCEHMGRYEDFSAFLAQNGVAVFGHDCIGHGRTAPTAASYGYFGRDGRRLVLADLHTANSLVHEGCPGVPVALLGHSMGSFFARGYAARWPQTIGALVLSGTGGPNPLAGVGVALASLLEGIYGPQHRSKLLFAMAFGSYLKRIGHPATRYDWLTRDAAVVAAFAADPLCNYRFTDNGYREMFAMLREVSATSWAEALPKSLPVLLVAGEEDPVGNYGAGVRQVTGMLQGAGVQNVTCTLYPGARHEVLNELDRQAVYADILAFLRRCFAG